IQSVAAPQISNGILDVSKFLNFTPINVTRSGSHNGSSSLMKAKLGSYWVVIKSTSYCQQTDPAFAKQVSIMQKLSGCPNLISLNGIVQRDGFFCLVMPFYANGDLQTKLCDPMVFKGDWARKRCVMLGIANGLQYLHEAGVYHKKLQSSHILLDEYYEAKI